MKQKLFTAVIISTALCSASAFAVDGTINFKGEVIETGCKLEGTNNSQLVTLPKVAKTTFAGVDSTSGRTPFTIKLTDCPDNTAGNIKFEGTVLSGVVDTLANTGSAGDGIGIQVMKPNSGGLVVFNTKDGAGSFAGTDLSSGQIELSYTAQYVAKNMANINPGNVVAAVTLEISY